MYLFFLFFYFCYLYNKLKNKVKLQQKENGKLQETIQNLEQSVAERLQITNIRHSGTHINSHSPESKMKAVVTRRKLVDLAKLQSTEIEFLREQVDLLRKKTFASFPPQFTANFKVKEETKTNTLHLPKII